MIHADQVFLAVIRPEPILFRLGLLILPSLVLVETRCILIKLMECLSDSG